MGWDAEAVKADNAISKAWRAIHFAGIDERRAAERARLHAIIDKACEFLTADEADVLRALKG